MKVIDISWSIGETTTEYKDKKSIQCTKLKTIDRDGFRESVISFNAHTGTHIDAPSHFLRDGKTVDEMHIDRFVGKAIVLDLFTAGESVSKEELERYKIDREDIVLLRTSNSAASTTAPFNRDFVYLDASGAQYLIQCGVKAVGIDYLSLERNDPTHEVHTMLMKADIAIIEGLRLGHVQAGSYFLVCLPLLLLGLEAAPARAVLLPDVF